MDKYLDDYGTLDRKLIVADIKEAIAMIKDDDYSSAAEILAAASEALYNCEE